MSCKIYFFRLLILHHFTLSLFCFFAFFGALNFTVLPGVTTFKTVMALV